MNNTPDRHHRQSIRLRGYDYAEAGAYFVTICIQHKECLLGDIADARMTLNAFGAAVQECWDELPRHFPHVELDEFVAMPNHVHGIIVLNDTPVRAQRAPNIVGAQHAGPLRVAPNPMPQSAPTRINVTPGSLGAIVRSFKSAATKRINEIRATPGVPVWQRNYYEHVVRNDDELNRIRQYIMDNPAQWALDRENPNVPLVGPHTAIVGAQHAAPHRVQHAGPLRGRDDIERIFGGVRP